METMVFDGRLARDWLLTDFVAPAKKLLMVNIGSDPVGEGYLKAVRQLAQKMSVRLVEHDFPSSWGLDKIKVNLKELIGMSKKTEFVLNFSTGSQAYLSRQKLLDLIPTNLDADYLASRFLSDPDHLPSVVRSALKALEIGGEGLDRQKSVVAVLGSRGFWGQRVKLALEQTGWKKVVGLNKGELDQLGEADAIITCVGKPKLVTGKLIKRGAVVVDVGYSFENGQSWGDIDQLSAEGKVSFLTPVPGGVGPLSIGYLFDNFRQRK